MTTAVSFAGLNQTAAWSTTDTFSRQGAGPLSPRRAPPVDVAAPSRDPLEAVRALAATYRGSWQAFGLDAADRPFPAFAWTDELQGADPRIEGDEAVVTVSGVMTVGPGMKFPMGFVEGYRIAPDGTTGDRFFAMNGQRVVEEQVAPGVFRFETPLGPDDFRALINIRPDNLISGKHVSTRREVVNDGVARDLVSRETILSYRAADGSEKTVKFVSMTGYHDRVG